MARDHDLKHLSREERADLLGKLKDVIRDEFGEDLGDLRAELLLEALGKLLGPQYYNEAIADARAVAAERAETIQEELFGLTRQAPPEARR